MFLRTYSDSVTLLHLGSQDFLSSQDAPRIRDIECVPIALSDLMIDQDRVILFSAHRRREFDAVYLALGCSPHHDLARSLSAACDDHGALNVTAHQESSIPRLYAAGDVVRGLNQVVIAAAESAIAATDIHKQASRLLTEISP